MAYDPPLNNAFAIAPNDSGALGYTTDAISFVNASGTQTITVDFIGGQKQVSIILPTGFYKLRVNKVWNTGTTVTNIIGYRM